MVYGLQKETMMKTRLYVLPSTSGAARRFWDENYWHELAKKSVIALTRNITKDQFRNGLLIRLHADVTSNSAIAVLISSSHTSRF